MKRFSVALLAFTTLSSPVWAQTKTDKTDYLGNKANNGRGNREHRRHRDENKNQ